MDFGALYNRTTLFASLLVCCGVSLSAIAELSRGQKEQVDAIFRSWDEPNSPGGVVGVMRGDRQLFKKAYGLASLEYLTPNSVSTRFNLASVSKQMTAMAVVRLHLAGRLSVDDDIRKHLTDLPDFGEPITIRHLLHHTSGLRSNHALLRLAGWRADDVRDNNDLYRFMRRQRDLNFKPGEEYLYCNTGYIFLAEIVERLSGESFVKWMKREVFEPLNMQRTYVEDNHNSVVKNRATSYLGSKEAGFERSVEYWGYYGAGNVYATIDSVLIWLRNFYDVAEGWKPAFQMLETQSPLNSGRPNDYAFGVSIAEDRGLKRIQHNGATGGYRTVAKVYPEAELSIAVLANFSSANVGGKADQIAGIVLGSRDQDAAESTEALPEAVDLSEGVLESLVGTYWLEPGGLQRRVLLKEGRLIYRGKASDDRELIPVASREFFMKTPLGLSRVLFDQTERDQNRIRIFDDYGVRMTGIAFDPIEATPDTLSHYAGEFYSDELETSYRLFLRDGHLILHHPRHGDGEATWVNEDIVRWPNAYTRYARGKDGQITGIFVTNGRVRNLWMQKVK